MDRILAGFKITADGGCTHEIRRLCSLVGGNYDKPRQWIKKKKKSHHFADKNPYRQSYGFYSRHIQMWELDQKEGWATKNSFVRLHLQM